MKRFEEVLILVAQDDVVATVGVLLEAYPPMCMDEALSAYVGASA